MWGVVVVGVFLAVAVMFPVTAAPAQLHHPHSHRNHEKHLFSTKSRQHSATQGVKKLHILTSPSERRHLEEEDEVSVVKLFAPLIGLASISRSSGFLHPSTPMAPARSSHHTRGVSVMTRPHPEHFLAPSVKSRAVYAATRGHTADRDMDSFPISRFQKRYSSFTRSEIEELRESAEFKGDLKILHLDDRFLMPIVVGEFGALLSQASYASVDASTDVKEAIQNEIDRLHPLYDVEVKDVTIDSTLDLLFYTATFMREGEKVGAIVFRGTTGPLNGANWQNNLKMSLNEDKTAPEGLWDNYAALRSHVRRAVEDLSREPLPGGLLVLGHSMGGALATYAGLDISRMIREEMKDIPHSWLQVLTYGQPRDGTPQLASEVDSRLNKVRFIAHGDPVPSWPVSRLSIPSISSMMGKWTRGPSARGKTRSHDNKEQKASEIQRELNAIANTEDDSGGGVDEEEIVFEHSGVPVYLDLNHQAYLAQDPDFSGPPPQEFVRMILLSNNRNLIDLHLGENYIRALDGVREHLMPNYTTKDSKMMDSEINEEWDEV